uniref:Copine I n=1 Tax=Oncorhynchus mykiss TaxID=8022 RepID=A0A8K9XCN5_ONCMY
MVDTQCVSKVKLSISCSNLLNKDVGSKSDPLCVMMQSIGNDKWTELDRTERVKNCQDPEFSKKLLLDYHFERVQKLKLGCTLGQIVSSKKLTRPLQMKKGKPAGKGIITITAEEIKDNRDIVLELEAKGLDKKDLFGKSYPFLEFFKQEDDGRWQLVHRTEVIKNTLSPSWNKFSVALQTFYYCDMSKPIKVHCSDYDSDGSHEHIGVFQTNVSEIQKAGFLTVHPEKKKKSYKNSGVIRVKCCQIQAKYTFLDYVMGGCRIHFTVGIDFTGSNGDPRSPQSLHYLSPDVLNPYLAATWSVGLVVQDYETCAPGHPTPLGHVPPHPFCCHLLMCLKFLITNLLISQTPDQTRDAIVKASRLPMSIIIIGVGEANFKAMELLDGDEGILKSLSGKPVARDIVQFVPFRQFANDPKEALAQSVLAEVPNQLMSYFKMLKLDPVNVAAIKT